MGRVLSSVSRGVALSIGTLALAACGGGSGGDPQPQPNALAGAYHYIALERDGAGDVRSVTGQASADGLGTLTFGSSYAAEEGTSSGPFARGAMSYAVAGPQDLTIVDPGGLAFAGRMEPGGAEAALAQFETETDLGWMLLVRRATAPAQADLTGTWGLVRWERRPGVGEYALSGRGEVDISAVGLISYLSYDYNADGSINPAPVFHLAEELIVGTDGWILGRSLPAHTVLRRGGIAEDKNLVVLGNDIGAGGQADVRVLVRKTSVTDAMLSGTYGSFGFLHSGFQWQSWYGTMTFDGAGSGVWARTLMTGTSANHESRSMAYGLSFDYFLGLHSSGDFVQNGFVGPGGRYVVFGGLFSPTRSPLIDFIVR